MWPDGLFAIFCKGTFWNGSKPLPMFLYFQEINKTRRKMMMCREMVGPFKNSRAESTNALFYLIIFVCRLIYRKRVWFVWQGIALVFIKTWVRAPGPHPFLIILHLTFLCNFSFKDHHASTISGVSLGQ